MIRRGRFGTLVLLLLTMACGGGATLTPGPTNSGATPSQSSSSTEATGSPSATSAPDSPFTEADGLIAAIIPAADIDEDGQPVDAGFSFSQDSAQITIVALAGEVTGTSAMNFTWFQVTENEDVELFTHTVDVASFQAAYSVGTNPGTLTPGSYRVEAALVGESRSTQFEVEVPEPPTASSSIVGARTPAGGVAGGDASSGAPASGGSGAVETGPSDPSFGEGPYARFILMWAGLDPDSAGLELQFRAGSPGGDAIVELQATMGGNTRTLEYPVTGQQSEVLGWVNFDPCVHPGGSDLPGTDAEFSVSVIEPGDLIQAGGFDTTTLGPDESKPIVRIDSEPPSGSQVAPDDEIVLSATAEENRDGPTWQDGLNSLQLIANPGGPVGPGERSAAGSPQSCDNKQWTLNYEATYIVPDDAPAIISICGEALDFAGNFSDPDSCNEYYTGQVWEGAVTGQTDQPSCEPATTPITGWMELVVADDGTVTGTVTEGRAGFSCGGTEAPGYELTYDITGQKTEEAFDLLIDGTLSVTLPISDTHATVTVSRPGAGGFGAETTYTVDCITCPSE